MDHVNCVCVNGVIVVRGNVVLAILQSHNLVALHDFVNQFIVLFFVAAPALTVVKVSVERYAELLEVLCGSVAIQTISSEVKAKPIDTF